MASKIRHFVFYLFFNVTVFCIMQLYSLEQRWRSNHSHNQKMSVRVSAHRKPSSHGASVPLRNSGMTTYILTSLLTILLFLRCWLLVDVFITNMFSVFFIEIVCKCMMISNLTLGCVCQSWLLEAARDIFWWGFTQNKMSRTNYFYYLFKRKIAK